MSHAETDETMPLNFRRDSKFSLQDILLDEIFMLDQ